MIAALYFADICQQNAAMSKSSRVHGGIDEAECKALGVDPLQVADFSVNLNPYGPTPAVVDAARSAMLDRYPDSSATALRNAIAAMQGVASDRIVAGSGAADLLWTLARVLLSADQNALIVEPAFSEFRAAAQSVGARCIEWRACEQHSFAVHLPDVAALLDEFDPRTLYLASPNTPTGTAVPLAKIAELALKHPRTTVVLDESFLAMSDRHDEAGHVAGAPNLVRVRSLTKDHAIPGLRIGYLICDSTLAQKLESARPAWSTSAPAQSAAVQALKETQFVAESREKLFRDRDWLVAQLRELGLAPLPTSTFFFLVPVPGAADIRRKLLREGILVRDCTSFGLPRHIRISARPRQDSERLIAAMHKILIKQ